MTSDNQAFTCLLYLILVLQQQINKLGRGEWGAPSTHDYRSVLIETFVDTTQYQGTCYQSANWLAIGETSGKDWKSFDDNNKEGTVKKLFVFPLNPNFRTILKNEPVSHQKAVIDEDFLNLWGRYFRCHLAKT